MEKTYKYIFEVILDRLCSALREDLSFQCCYCGVQRHLVVVNCYSQTRRCFKRSLLSLLEGCTEVTSPGLRDHFLIYCPPYCSYDGLLYY